MAGPTTAQLMLNPTRLVFDKNQRTAQVDLVNPGTQPVTYRISLVNRRMSEAGDIMAADQPLPGEQFAEELLRYSPRQVSLEPGGSQVVRVQLRKPAGLAPGEYRSHLLFSQVADEPTAAGPGGNNPPSGAEAGKGLGVKITALVGLSIPVIVRHGATEARAAFSDLRLEPEQAGKPGTLALVLHREGNRSLYGDLRVSFAPAGGAERPVTEMKGVAVYTPNALRRVRLTLPPATASGAGTLRVVYQERPDSGGALLAESLLKLP